MDYVGGFSLRPSTLIKWTTDWLFIDFAHCAKNGTVVTTILVLLSLNLLFSSAAVHDNNKKRMRSSRVVTVPGCQCQSRNTPGFDPSVLRHSEI